jgi:hypothetical protein
MLPRMLRWALALTESTLRGFERCMHYFLFWILTLLFLR